MRSVLAFLVVATFLAAFSQMSTQASAADYRWAQAFAQGTTEATVSNEHAASINIYCPAGQAETTPGMIIQVRTVTPKAGEKVAVRFVIDGKTHTFEMDEIQFKADGPGLSALSALIDALTRAKSKSFAVEYPKLGVTERFSLLGAKKAMTSAKEFLDGCE
jgi:hypothetical protein